MPLTHPAPKQSVLLVSGARSKHTESTYQYPPFAEEKNIFHNSLCLSCMMQGKTCVKCVGISKGGQALNSCCYVHISKVYHYEKKTRKEKRAFSVTQTKIKAKKCPSIRIWLLLTCNKLIGYAAHREIIVSVLVDMLYHTPVQSNLLTNIPVAGSLLLRGQAKPPHFS